MTTLLQYAIEAVVVTGVLYLNYRLLIDRKVGHGWARAYLLGALLLGAVIPALDIPVWAGEVVYIEAVEPMSEPIGTSAAAEMVQEVNPQQIAWLIYAVGAVVTAVLILRQCRAIGRIRRRAVRTEWMGYALIRTELPITPFSFLRTIYVWQQTPDEELPTILAHESSHIRRGHTAERLVVEGFKVLFWWNPFCWLTARTLAEVEEFEADQDVLCGGFSHDEYMTTLFRQQFGLSPDIANGLPHSFTKKRFQMMTKQINSSHQGLRATAVAVVVTGLVCAFSLRAQATEYRTFNASVETKPSIDAPKQTFRLVVTNNRSPIVGATIVVVGTQRGMTTDFNGVATIEAAAGDQLRIDYIGYDSRTITLGKENELIVVLTPSDQQPRIDEIVVESYGVPSDEETPFVVVEQMPTFEGGDINSFRQWVMERIRPCKNDAGELLTGRVIVQFAIERDGRLTIGQVVQTPDSRLSNEVIRLLAASPRWNAGMQRGKKVRVQCTLPIDFRASEEATATTPNSAAAATNDEPFLVVEQMPTFEGGDINTFRQWVMERIRPCKSDAGEPLTGRVIAQFAIERDGSLTFERILRTPDKRLSDEVQRVIESSPRWKAGTQRGHAVRVRFTLPVDFAK